MAFVIKNITFTEAWPQPYNIVLALMEAIEQSRFTGIKITHDLKKIEIRHVRLRESKDYCGNHPYACPVRPLVKEKPHKHSKCLEGADWVAFNDMINDVLDEHGICADVASSLCVIRKGGARRVEYRGHTLANGIDSEWDKDSDYYESHLGETNVPRSEYPKDTPGIAEWKRNYV